MPKLRRLSGAEVRAILESHGFVLVRQTGSHMILQKQTEAGTISATVPAHREVAIGTLSNIIRQSQLGRGPFEA